MNEGCITLINLQLSPGSSVTFACSSLSNSHLELSLGSSAGLAWWLTWQGVNKKRTRAQKTGSNTGAERGGGPTIINLEVGDPETGMCDDGDMSTL